MHKINLDSLKTYTHTISQHAEIGYSAVQLFEKTTPLLKEELKCTNLIRMCFLSILNHSKMYTQLIGKNEPSELNLSRVNLYDYLNGLCSRISRFAIDPVFTSIKLKKSPQTNVCATIDPYIVEVILFNLISNSLKHGRANSQKIKISFSETKTKYSITVSDNGLGVPLCKQKLVSQTLAQPSKFRDKGLGLCLSQKLATLMGGKISWKNTKIGANFTLSIPKSIENKVQKLNEYQSFEPDPLVLEMYFADIVLDKLLY